MALMALISLIGFVIICLIVGLVFVLLNSN